MGTPPQTVVRAAQPCSLPFSSLVPSPQHRRTTSDSAEHPLHPDALLLLLQTSPSLSGLSPMDLPQRRTAMLRERMCLLGRRRSRRTCPPGSGPLLEAVTLFQAP